MQDLHNGIGKSLSPRHTGRKTPVRTFKKRLRRSPVYLSLIHIAGIALEKIIITAEPGGKLTDENLVQQHAIAEAAKSVITMEMCIRDSRDDREIRKLRKQPRR